VQLQTILKGPTDDLVAEDRFPLVSGFQGDPLEEESYLLLSRYDGDLKNSVVELVDLQTFEVLHKWNPDLDYINSLVDTTNPEFEFLHRDRNEDRYQIVNPLLLDDGGLVFNAMESPLVKVDFCSELVWQNQEDNFHHGIEQDEDGNIWVPTFMFPYALDRKYVGADYDNYKDDAITKVSADGHILYQKSVSEIFIENNMEYLLTSLGDRSFDNDPIHLNDIQPVLRNSDYWKKGDVFLSIREQSMIMLYRPSQNAIVWIGTGHTFEQHDVDILDDHRISIFDNNTKVFYDGGRQVDGHNNVIIYDFKNDEYSSYMDAILDKHEVRTITEGRSQILGNGHLFIEETNYARTLYFGKDGTLLWQHVNRAANGNVYFTQWSRILYQDSDIKKVRNILASEKCEND